MTEEIKILKDVRGPDSVNITVVGCCGMGCNALRSAGFPDNVKTIAIGTERREITGTHADVEMLVDPKDSISVAKSVHSRMAATKVENEIAYLLKGSDIVFTIAGLGGNSGGWTASMVAKTAKLAKAVSVSLVTIPFTAEGRDRKQRSTNQLEYLRGWADAVIPLKNDLIVKEVANLPMLKAFEVMNTVIGTPISKFTGFDKKGLRTVKELFKHNHIFRLDAADFRGDNAIFGINEQLKSSNWLSLGMLDPKSAIIFLEDYKPDEKLAAEFADEFRKMVGHDVPLIINLKDTGSMSMDTSACVLIGF